MASLAQTEMSLTKDSMDSSKITINTSNSKLILENNSSDLTISKYEAPNTFVNIPPISNTSMTMKTQVLPLVYIQNAPKIPYAAVNSTKNNVIVNNIPPLQFATIATKATTSNTMPVNLSTNQNLIFTGRPQSLVIQKPQGNVLPVLPVPVTGNTKIGAYLTMIKPVATANDSSNVNKIEITSGGVSALNQFSLLNNNTYLQSQNSQQKFVLAPMPNITSNRLPATATTNSVQPKIALLPVPNSEPKVFNLKMTDSQPQKNDYSGLKLVENLSNENSLDRDNESDNLVCDEYINLESPEKNRTYELSIAEDSLSSQGEFNTSMIVSKTSNNKEIPKFPKHGVSILKKNYNFVDRRQDKPILTLNNGTNYIQENNKQEMNTIKLCSPEEETVIITVPPTKPERRRKSNFSYRKEFDDIEITTSPDLSTNFNTKSPESDGNMPNEDPTQKLTSEIEIELVKEKTPEPQVVEPVVEPQEKEEVDFQKLLTWEDGIGTLPGSNLKFIINEFNILEYITGDEYKAIVEKRKTQNKDKLKTDQQEEMRCLECGCYGLPSEFINPRYCSHDCQENFQTKMKKEKQERFKKKKKKAKTDSSDSVKSENKDEDISEEDSLDTNSVQDKLTTSYPWTCKKKGFSWSKYLEHVKAKPAPVKLFKDPFPYNRNGFRPGMKLEGVDPQHPSYFCVLTVAEVVGYRIRLHFDGYPVNYDFWCNADSMDIFPMGWCEKHGHVLHPPPGYTIENFNWLQYLKQTKATAAPKHLFANRAGQAICPNGFRVGMKLEAVDRKNTSLVCVATVRDMMDNRILVHFDSWDDIYDYWADPTSPYIHPVGWCDQYGHNLTPPNDYPNPESFTWEEYLKETKSVAAPVRAFKQRPACGFKRGMRLECVDKRVPLLIRVSTVDDVREHQIRIHFDGWLDRYSYWVDDDSPDIHPVGWCQKTGHPIEPPLTPDDVYDFVECRTVGCKGIGHIKGPKFVTHSSQKHCPYAEDNLDLEKILPDRLLSPDKSPEEAVPVSREPKECKIKPRLGRPPKHSRFEPPKPEPSEESTEIPEKKLKRNTIKPAHITRLSAETEQKAIAFIERAKLLPAEVESWHRHSQFLKRFMATDIDPRSWSNRDVIEFVSTIPCCHIEIDVFRKEAIDGEALLSLNQKDILSMLKLKVGPAVKLYNSIVLLRQHVDEKLL